VYDKIVLFFSASLLPLVMTVFLLIHHFRIYAKMGKSITLDKNTVWTILIGLIPLAISLIVISILQREYFLPKDMHFFSYWMCGMLYIGQTVGSLVGRIRNELLYQPDFENIRNAGISMLTGACLGIIIMFLASLFSLVLVNRGGL